MTPDPDHELLSAIACGEPDAARRLVADKLPRILALASRLLGDASEAQDVAQETFVRVWRIAPGWKPGRARFDTWIHTVTLNLCRDRLRRRRLFEFGDVPDAPDPAIGADLQLDQDSRAQAVADALKHLPERQREALVLQYYQGLSNTAAADVMGISVEALESLLSRGRRRLRELLIEHQP